MYIDYAIFVLIVVYNIHIFYVVMIMRNMFPILFGLYIYVDTNIDNLYHKDYIMCVFFNYIYFLSLLLWIYVGHITHFLYLRMLIMYIYYIDTYFVLFESTFLCFVSTISNLFTTSVQYCICNHCNG